VYVADSPKTILENLHTALIYLLLIGCSCGVLPQITTPTPYSPKTILYGFKQPGDSVWQFSLPKSCTPAAYNVIRHEQHTELLHYLWFPYF
jgi:hypothetical protein